MSCYGFVEIIDNGYKFYTNKCITELYVNELLIIEKNTL